MRPGERLTLACTDLDDEGAGIGESAEQVVHVAGALPGERVAAVVEHVSRQAPSAWARLERVELPSLARRPPVCRAFGACGGCVLQHLDYAAQLEWKRARVARAFTAHPALRDVAIEACVASPRPLRYRNKSKLVAARAGGRLVLGAYAARTHDVVDLAGCQIAEPPLDDVAQGLRTILDDAGVRPYDERTLTGDLRHVILRVSVDGEVLAALVVARPLADGQTLGARIRAARPEVIGVVEHLNQTRGNAILSGAGTDAERILWGEDELDDRVVVGGRPLWLALSASAFFQANRDVAGLAYGAIAAALAVRPGERVADAYSGVGGIALALAPGAGEVVGIESHAAATARAAAAAARNGAANARFVTADAAAGLAALDRVDVVVLNPPRKGCDAAVLAQVARLAPRAVAYLSCDPDTLARDLAALAGHGYRTRAVTPFDMLPHTPHVEALAVLERGAAHTA